MDIVKDILETGCACSSSPFLYGPCGHVVSGDLNIICNREIRDLMKIEAKYIGNQQLNLGAALGLHLWILSLILLTKCAPSLSYL